MAKKATTKKKTTKKATKKAEVDEPVVRAGKVGNLVKRK
jgi:hypothetical protein